MNIASSRLLEDSISGAANQFQRSRETDIAARRADQDAAMRQQMLDAEIQRGKTAESHYGEMRDTAAERNRINDDRYTAGATTAAAKQALAEKAEFFKSVSALNATDQLTDESREKVNQFLANDEHFGTTGIQLKKPDPAFLKKSAQGKQPAMVQTVESIKNYRDQAAQSQDPEQAKQFNSMADDLQKFVDKAGAAKAAQLDSVTTTTDLPATPDNPGTPATPPGTGLLGTGLFASPGTLAVPPVAGHPAMHTRVTSHVPVGTVPSPLGAPPPPPSMNGDFGDETANPAPLPDSAPVQSPTMLGTPPAPNTNGVPAQVITATHPVTGQKVQFVNGKWIPIPQPPQQ